MVFHLASQVTGRHDLGVAEEFAQAGDEEFAEQDGEAGIMSQPEKLPIPGEGGDENADEQLVGDGVEHAAERGILVPARGRGSRRASR